MEQPYYEIHDNFFPVFNTAIALLKERGNDGIYKLISTAEVSVINTEYDGWNGGTYGYTVSIGLSIKQYSALSAEAITDMERTIETSINEVIKGDSNNYFIVKICPSFHNEDINWERIGGQSGKIRLKQNLETIKNIMVSVATGGNRISEEDDRYKTLHSHILRDCKNLNLTYNNTFASLWDWYGKWKADFPTYQDRREYIKNLLSPTLSYFDIPEIVSFADSIVELDDWERIKRTLLKIKMNSVAAKDEEDFQAIGLLCRDVILSLAQAVYSPDIHGMADETGKQIGPADASRMIGNYVCVKFQGAQNKEVRTYIKATNDLANQLTHKRSATKKDMLLTVSATIALINFIGIIEEKF